MKKIIKTMLLVTLLPTLSLAAPKQKPVEKVLYYENKANKVNTVIYDGVSLMEVRTFAEALGFELGFSTEGQAKVVHLRDKFSQRVLEFYVKSQSVILHHNGMSLQLTSNYNTTVIDGRTYVPVRFLAESMGYSIDLKDNAYYVTVPNKDVTPPGDPIYKLPTPIPRPEPK